MAGIGLPPQESLPPWACLGWERPASARWATPAAPKVVHCILRLSIDPRLQVAVSCPCQMWRRVRRFQKVSRIIPQRISGWRRWLTGDGEEERGQHHPCGIDLRFANNTGPRGQRGRGGLQGADCRACPFLTRQRAGFISIGCTPRGQHDFLPPAEIRHPVRLTGLNADKKDTLFVAMIAKMGHCC